MPPSRIHFLYIDEEIADEIRVNLVRIGLCLILLKKVRVIRF